MSRKAAVAGDISEMISEYVLPVVAVLIVGVLAKASRHLIESVMRRIPCLMTAVLPAPDNDPKPQPLPIVAGGDGFSGITGSLSIEAMEEEARATLR